MSPRHRLILLAACGAVAACSQPAPAPVDNGETTIVAPDQQADPVVPAANAVDPGAAAKVQADYLGKWIGPEGLVMEVKAKPGGGVTIANQWTLDDKGTFDGSVTAEGLRWMRNGTAVTATHSNGDATGMKWLAGKQDCLTVQPGEGYCRD